MHLKSMGVGFGVLLTVSSPTFAQRKCFGIKTEALGEDISILPRADLVHGCFRTSGVKGRWEYWVGLSWCHLEVSRCGGPGCSFCLREEETLLTGIGVSHITLGFSCPTCLVRV